MNARVVYCAAAAALLALAPALAWSQAANPPAAAAAAQPAGCTITERTSWVPRTRDPESVSDTSVIRRPDGRRQYVSPNPYGKSGSYLASPTLMGSCCVERGHVIGSLPVGL